MRLLDRLLGLGPSDEPRPVAVGRRAPVVERPLVSTPGAALRVERSGHDGHLIRLLAWCHRERVPVEIVEGSVDRVTLHGRALSPTEARAALGGRSR